MSSQPRPLLLGARSEQVLRFHSFSGPKDSYVFQRVPTVSQECWWNCVSLTGSSLEISSIPMLVPRLCPNQNRIKTQRGIVDAPPHQRTAIVSPRQRRWRCGIPGKDYVRC